MWSSFLLSQEPNCPYMWKTKRRVVGEGSVPISPVAFWWSLIQTGTSCPSLDSIEILGLMIEIFEDYGHIFNLLAIQTIGEQTGHLSKKGEKTELMDLLILDVNVSFPDLNNTPTTHWEPTHSLPASLSLKDAWIYSSQPGISLHHSFCYMIVWTYASPCGVSRPEFSSYFPLLHLYAGTQLSGHLISLHLKSQFGLPFVFLTYLCISAPAFRQISQQT